MKVLQQPGQQKLAKGRVMLPAWLQALQRPCQQWPAGKHPLGAFADRMSVADVFYYNSCQPDAVGCVTDTTSASLVLLIPHRMGAIRASNLDVRQSSDGEDLQGGERQKIYLTMSSSFGSSHHATSKSTRPEKVALKEG